MLRREFMSVGLKAGLVYGASASSASALARAISSPGSSLAAPALTWKPMAVGLLIKPARDPEGLIGRVKQLGLSNCFFSLDDYLCKYTYSLAAELQGLLEKYGVTATAA